MGTLPADAVRVQLFRAGGRSTAASREALSSGRRASRSLSAATDLLRWERNVDDVRVGDVEALRAMQMPAALSSGDPTRFGLGLEIAEHRGLKTVGHVGGDRGVATPPGWSIM